MGELAFSQAAFTKAAKDGEGAEGVFVRDGEWEDGALDYLNTFYDDARQNEFLTLERDALVELARTLWRLGETRITGEQLVTAVPLKEIDRTLLAVVMDDQAFLVDSIIAAVSSFGVDVHGLFHPIVSGFRSKDGGWVGKGDGAAISESVVGVVVPRLRKARVSKIVAEIKAAMTDVALVNADFQPMLAQIDAISEEVTSQHGDTGNGEVEEAVAFLDWMRNGNFVLLGSRTYDYGISDGTPDYAEPEIVEGSALGVLNDTDTVVLRQSSEPSVISSNVRAFLKNAPVLSLAKSNLYSRVHRRVRMDYVTIKRFDAKGRIVGEHRIVGLLTSEAYSRSAWDIPLIRRKLQHVLETSDMIEGSHKFNRLKYVLASYPRDELFQISVTDLARISTAVAQAFDRPRTRVFLRRDPFDRFVSVLVYTPREHYSTRVRSKIGSYLADAFNGRVSAFYPQYSDAPMARVHFIIGLDADAGTFPPVEEIESDIAVLVRPWEQALLTLAEDRDIESDISAFVRGFPVAYRDIFTSDDALEDSRELSKLSETGQVGVRVVEIGEGDKPDVRFRIYSRGDRLEPSNVNPVLENFALHVVQETGYAVKTKSGTYWVHDFELYLDVNADAPKGSGKAFAEGFLATWNGLNIDDGFNRLVLPQAAGWRDVAFLRLVAAYRRQTGLDPSQDIQVEALERYPELTGLLIDLFHARFDPETFSDVSERKTAVGAIHDSLLTGLADVASLEHDQVIRRMAKVIATSLRTNFHQREDGALKPYISLKIDSSALEALPAPVPYREIFVSSPRVDGVHLRFGPIARGGLRWSDRRDDFRAEVLGLVKAQQVKNSVIVPVGSKGGFYPKLIPAGASRDVAQQEAIGAYTTFISGLLDLTDSYAGDDVRHPVDTVRWDDDDPYLVVAADKGTATFSDIANGIARDYDFWLDDAFASGGSVGYDHKVMGITARGAWEAVKRHFREMGKDIQSEAFTVLGIGDMSGDVFGNGMLLSEHIQLRAAFNHMHIFIDPSPDAKASFKERKRLFEMGRSSWTDYTAKLITKGGGVFERSAKSIALTDEMKDMTGVSQTDVTPDELIHALLKMPVELMWFGGIGTYVKAAGESDAEVRDKANDNIRVDAGELRASVIGEGANLGMTQAGRIAAARKGVRLNTDAVDNSAGVDSSDHEVNIKILLRGAIETGELKSEARDDLLAEMTDEVADLVLQHNYDQTAALSLLEARADEDHDAYGRFMKVLEDQGALDRAVEGLPSTEEMTGREALTRPELAVLHSYAKIEAYKDLMDTDFAEDDYYANVIEDYFPKRLASFEKAMVSHRLRKEIIASRVVNLIIDVCGPLFLPRVSEQTRAGIHDISDAFMVAYDVLEVAKLRGAISELDNDVAASAQVQLSDEIARVLARVVAWMLRMRDKGSIAERIARRGAVRDIVDAAWLELLSPYDKRRAESRTKRFVKAGINEELALDVALLRSRASSFDVIALADKAGIAPKCAAELFYRVGGRFKIDRIRSALLQLEPDSHWDALALRHLQEEMFAAQADFAGSVAAFGVSDDTKASIAKWIKSELGSVAAYDDTIQTMLGDKGWTVAKFSIVANLLQGLRERASNTELG